MKNPFKFGTIVEDEFFTDRTQELQRIQQVMDSENHLILISPRRFGKSSLVLKAIKTSKRPFLVLNLQNVVSTEDLAARLLKEAFKLHPWEHIKHLMSHFRIVPTISVNPLSNGVDITFQPALNSSVILEDVMSLIERLSTPENKLIVVLDEFQEIKGIAHGLDKQLRAIMQTQKHLNYIILGSQESMMTEIFERKKSPFYHFGVLMRLNKIPPADFYTYIEARLQSVLPTGSSEVANQILAFTNCHPYYTQQLASQVWELACYEQQTDHLVETAIERLSNIHDLDFERLWLNFNRMDRRVLQALSVGQKVNSNRQIPTSTLFSTLKRLMQAGYIIRTEQYEIEDPIFRNWIAKRQ